MKKLKWLIVCLLFFSGCTIKEKEKSAVLKPAQLPEYIPVVKEEVPVMIGTLYAQRDNAFHSVFGVLGEMNIHQAREMESEILTIDNWTDFNQKASYVTYGLTLKQGHTYQISVEIDSDLSSSGLMKMGNYTEQFSTKKFTSGQVIWNYKHTDSTTEGILTFEFDKSTDAEAGTIHLTSFRMKDLDEDEIGISINQIGYFPDSQKLAIFKYNAGDLFEVINTKSNEVVYTGMILDGKDNPETGEINYVGDFSAVTEPGSYRIVSQMGQSSYKFEIKDDIYSELFQDAFKMITLQRCGQTLDRSVAGDFSHEFCHHFHAQIYGTEDHLDVTGGWHDAGDYGRYTLPAIKTITDLLLAYAVYPESFSDEMNIPESGNGIADVLDEAQVGLKWLKKMQIDWGPVYASAVTPNFAGFVSPEEDLQNLYVLPYENTCTAAAGGAFGLAAIVFRDVNPEAADVYLFDGEKAYDYAIKVRGEEDKKNPEDIIAGDYADDSDEDQIFFSAGALYAATHDEKYLKEVERFLEKQDFSLISISHNDMGGYGAYLFLQDEEFQKTEYYIPLYNLFMQEIMNLVESGVTDGYQLASDGYFWGGNMYVADKAMMMLLANDLAPSISLTDAAYEQLSYLLGRNSIHQSFITGYGINSPKNVHHRIAESRNILLKGALVGGPDDAIEADLPAAKKYWDESHLYSVNEVAIYYNSPLVFVLSGFQK